MRGREGLGARQLWGEKNDPVRKVRKLPAFKTFVLRELVNGKIRFPFLKVNNVSVFSVSLQRRRIWPLSHRLLAFVIAQP